MIHPVYNISAFFGSGFGVLCEVVQMNFGLQKFKLVECLFYCFNEGSYLLRHAEDSSYSQHNYNTRVRIT